MILPWRAFWSFPRLLHSEKVGGLASEAVPILCQHQGDAASSHEIPYTGPTERTRDCGHHRV
jgi:hypothetical protein